MSEPHTDPAGELRDAIAQVVFDAILGAYPETMTVCARKAADALLASEQFTIGLRDDLEDDIAESMQDPAFREAFAKAEARSEERSCEEAFEKWYDALDKRGRHINTDAFREGFAAGWAARTPTLPAPPYDDDSCGYIFADRTRCERQRAWHDFPGIHEFVKP